VGRDPDDWFDEPEAGDPWGTRVDRVVRERAEREDWLRESPESAPARSSRIHVDRRVAVVAALGVCLLLGILAAAGVFSGGSKSPAAVPTTTAPQTPTTTAVTTTTKTTPAVVVPTTPLKPGDTGTDVVQLQHALAQAGFSPGKADGDYGAATTQAVKSFQSANGLTADGVAGPKTLAALETALQSG
jgi:hypothetical protein